MEVVKISWSGGKDSTAAVLLHLQAGHQCKIVNYVPMFDDHTPLLLREHIDFIEKTKNYFREQGCEVYTVKVLHIRSTFIPYQKKENIRGE